MFPPQRGPRPSPPHSKSLSSKWIFSITSRREASLESLHTPLVDPVRGSSFRSQLSILKVVQGKDLFSGSCLQPAAFLVMFLDMLAWTWYVNFMLKKEEFFGSYGHGSKIEPWGPNMFLDYQTVFGFKVCRYTFCWPTAISSPNPIMGPKMRGRGAHSSESRAQVLACFLGFWAFQRLS